MKVRETKRDKWQKEVLSQQSSKQGRPWYQDVNPHEVEKRRKRKFELKQIRALNRLGMMGTDE